MKVTLAPTLEKFVSKKLDTGSYLDASEVIRESLRRWKEQEEAGQAAADWLEEQLQEGLGSSDLPGGPAFWRDLRKELHKPNPGRNRRHPPRPPRHAPPAQVLPQAARLSYRQGVPRWTSALRNDSAKRRR